MTEQTNNDLPDFSWVQDWSNVSAVGVAGRHEQKEVPEGVDRGIAGGYNDMTLVRITPEGRARSEARGAAVLAAAREYTGKEGLAIGPHVSLVSRFLRTRLTRDAFMKGATPGRLDPTVTLERDCIGFNGVDWDTHLPAYGSVEGNWVKALYEAGGYFPHPGGENLAGEPFANMAQTALDFMTAFYEGTQELANRMSHDDSRMGLLTMFSHTPNADTWYVTGREGVDVDLDARTATVTDTFPDGLRQGEVAPVVFRNLSDPSQAVVETNLQGKVRGYTMQDLRRVTAKLYTHTQA